MTRQSSRVKWISASVPKSGNRAEENEDAAACAPDGRRFAVADGATEGWESGPWARHLARCYIRRPPGPADFDRWLRRVRQAWKPPTQSGPVSWYAAEKSDQGSFAAFVGLELGKPRRQWTDDSIAWTWKAVAIGDSCLLHIRGERIEVAFPLSAPDAFGKEPHLVPSLDDTACPSPEWLAGRAQLGDLFLLATDAAAMSLLKPGKLAPALEAVRAAIDSGEQKPLLNWFRNVQTTVNDDVSLVAVQLPSVVEAS